MVYLGYILPTQNQKIYDSDVALALANYQKDLLNTKFEKMPVEEQQKLIDLINEQSKIKPTETSAETPRPLTIEDYTKLINTPINDPLNDYRTQLWNFVNKQEPINTIKINIGEVPTEKIYPTVPKIDEPLGMEPKIKMTPKEMAIVSAISLREQELKRPLTAPEKIDISNMVENQGKLSASINSPTSTEKSTITLTNDSSIQSINEQIEQLKELIGFTRVEEEIKKLEKKKLKEIFIREVKNGVTIYGARSNSQKTKEEKNILKINKNNELIFQDGSPFRDNLLTTTLKINSGITEGIKGKGVSSTNGEKNFGNFHLSLPALRKGNLTIYRPKSNTALISRRNISPLLIKVINSIRSNMKFELDDYNHLKIMEQKVIDHIINLLHMDYPPKMKRALDEENWHLKQRYEILLSEINAGNGGYMVVNELKGVLAKLKENKVINKRKYDMIISALN